MGRVGVVFFLNSGPDCRLSAQERIRSATEQVVQQGPFGLSCAFGSQVEIIDNLQDVRRRDVAVLSHRPGSQQSIGLPAIRRENDETK